MANKLYEENNIQAIADAIRAKGGTSGKLTVAQMAAAIAAIEGGGGSTKVATGTFTAGASGSDRIDITFDTPLEKVPDLIFYHEITVDQYSYTHVKMAGGVSSGPILGNGSGQTYPQFSLSGSSTLGYNIYGTSYPITYTRVSTSVSYPQIRLATAQGFSAFGRGANCLLRGTYRYVAVCF